MKFSSISIFRHSNIKVRFSLMTVELENPNAPDFTGGKADDRNRNYGHPKISDMKLCKNLFC